MPRKKRQDPPDPERDARVAKTRRRGPPKRVYVLYDWSQEVVGLLLVAAAAVDCVRPRATIESSSDEERARTFYLSAGHEGHRRAVVALLAEVRREEREASTGELRAEVERLRALLNTPELVDFAKAVPLEAAHQRERWSTDHDAGKTPGEALTTRPERG